MCLEERFLSIARYPVQCWNDIDRGIAGMSSYGNPVIQGRIRRMFVQIITT